MSIEVGVNMNLSGQTTLGFYIMLDATHVDANFDTVVSTAFKTFKSNTTLLKIPKMYADADSIKLDDGILRLCSPLL